MRKTFSACLKTLRGFLLRVVPAIRFFKYITNMEQRKDTIKWIFPFENISKFNVQPFWQLS